MNDKKRSTVMLLILLTVTAFAFYAYQTAQNAPAPAQLALPTLIPGAALPDGVQPVEVTVASVPMPIDSTPNYDPNDPYGVKFGLGGLGILLVLILVQYGTQAAGNAIGNMKKPR